MKKIAHLNFGEDQQRLYIEPEVHGFVGFVEMGVIPEGVIITRSDKSCTICGSFAVFKYRHISLCPMCKDLIKGV